MPKVFNFDKLPSDYDIETDIIKEKTLLDDKFQEKCVNGSLDYDYKEMEHLFNRYLYKKGYAKSTVNNYVNWVKIVMDNEKIETYEKLFIMIDTLCEKYDTGGKEEVFGNYGKRTVINALKRFKEFSKQIDMQIKRLFSTT